MQFEVPFHSLVILHSVEMMNTGPHHSYKVIQFRFPGGLGIDWVIKLTVTPISFRLSRNSRCPIGLVVLDPLTRCLKSFVMLDPRFNVPL